MMILVVSVLPAPDSPDTRIDWSTPLLDASFRLCTPPAVFVTAAVAARDTESHHSDGVCVSGRLLLMCRFSLPSCCWGHRGRGRGASGGPAHLGMGHGVVGVVGDGVGVGV